MRRNGSPLKRGLTYDFLKEQKKRERGSTLLEFAVTIIILLTFLFGIIDFSRALYTYHFVAHSAREATRYAVVRGSQCQLLAANGCPATSTSIETFVQGMATGIGVDKNSVEVTSNWSVPTYDGSGPQTENCTLNTTTGLLDNPGCMIQVTVAYPFKFIFPFMPSNTCTIGPAGQTVTGNICMTSTSEMVISQ